jgi:hypothetical protein
VKITQHPGGIDHAELHKQKQHNSHRVTKATGNALDHAKPIEHKSTNAENSASSKPKTVRSDGLARPNFNAIPRDPRFEGGEIEDEPKEND